MSITEVKLKKHMKKITENNFWSRLSKIEKEKSMIKDKRYKENISKLSILHKKQLKDKESKKYKHKEEEHFYYNKQSAELNKNKERNKNNSDKNNKNRNKEYSKYNTKTK